LALIVGLVGCSRDGRNVLGIATGEVKGAVKGTVALEDGESPEGVTITAKAADVVVTTKATADGSYAFDLPYGTYTVTAAKSGNRK